VITTSRIVESIEPAVDRSVIFADSYLNKLSGEHIEYECRRRLDTGCKELEVNFSKTEIVNSIGISILLGVIDTAANKGTKVVFSEVNDETVELFQMLGLTNHVVIE
jgi:anti-anti-sigma regulatory factor